MNATRHDGMTIPYAGTRIFINDTTTVDELVAAGMSAETAQAYLNLWQSTKHLIDARKGVGR